jgi:hypothetical protein
MALTTTIQPALKPEATTPGNNVSDGLLSMLMLAAYAGYMSKKSLRKLKRKMAWEALKAKFNSFFKPAASNRTLLLVILLIVALALVFINPIAALVAAIIVLLFYLAGII